MQAVTNLKPQYFHCVVHETMPAVREGTAETLAFMLSGVDPSERVSSSSLLRKLVKQLQRLELDQAGSEIRLPKNAETVKLVHMFAHKLLHRIYRTSIRHIEELSKRLLPVVSEPWYFSLLERVNEVLLNSANSSAPDKPEG